jgi:hypothetical protein
MSRSGYSDDFDGWATIRWRGAVKSAIRGKRGQAFLKELLDELDAMPVKRLIVEELEMGGEFCTLGVIGKSRGIDMTALQPEDTEIVSERLNLAEALVREIVYMNDEAGYFKETPECRFSRMRAWVAEQIRPDTPVSQ